jgi:hypothetical protein
MINILIYMLIFTWLYIIYYNVFYNKTYYLLYDENNNKYAMIDIFNILDPYLFDSLFKELYFINYFEKNEYIGLNYIDLYNLKDILLVIPYYSSYLTNNTIITSNNNKLVPYKININNVINKKKFKNHNFNLNKELYLKNIYNYRINKKEIPIFILSKEINEIKVNLERCIF